MGIYLHLTDIWQYFAQCEILQEQIVSFVSSIFLRRLLHPGVYHNSVLRTTLQDYNKHWTNSEFQSLTVDGLKKEILSLIEHEVLFAFIIVIYFILSFISHPKFSSLSFPFFSRRKLVHWSTVFLLGCPWKSKYINLLLEKFLYALFPLLVQEQCTIWFACWLLNWCCWSNQKRFIILVPLFGGYWAAYLWYAWEPWFS